MAENVFPKSEYQDVEKWPLCLALLQESKAYRDLWDKYGEKVREAIKKEPTINYYENPALQPPWPSSYWEVRKPWDEFQNILYNKYHIACKADNPDECLKILDPYKPEILDPDRLFLIILTPPAVTQIWVDGKPCEFIHISSTDDISLMPSERLLKIDLSKSLRALRADFEHFLKKVEQSRNDHDYYGWKSNYNDWNQDNSRYRVEVEQALNVWRLRCKKKTYREIARTLEIKEPAAKKAFRRAFELIEKTPYDPYVFRRETSKVKLSSLQDVCGACLNRNTCRELCPEALRFVNQDEVKQRELLIDPLKLS